MKFKKITINFLKSLLLSNLELKCSICNNYIYKYKPIPETYKDILEKHGYDMSLYGTSEHTNFKSYFCPICMSSDRERFFAEYFKKIIKNNITSKKMLHIAPSNVLNNKFLIKYFEVTTCDLEMEDVDLNVNIEDMNVFEDNSFDFIICSHVLEHVKNPDLALKEIFRILKKGGKSILMVPIILTLKNTIEDPSHTTKEERIKHYGQEDHLRSFSKSDFIYRIKNAGFRLEMLDIKKFTKKKFHELGLKDTSVLYIGNK
tara:strand:- start:758 stop:1534 length:777 start_codon:yes stop_codon:yes gene_type:complete